MHKQLEEYLAAVEKQLRSIPKQKRDDELKEMRQHLLNAIAANQEQGQPVDAAVANALTKFGTPGEASASVLIGWRSLLRQSGRKTFRTFVGIWTLFYGFMMAFGARTTDEMQSWFYGWVFTMGISALFLLVPPELRPLSESPLLALVRRRR